MGVFGAARYGQQTEGDCLVNIWLGGRKEGWIDLAMAFYLSISIPPMQVHCFGLEPPVVSRSASGISPYAASCFFGSVFFSFTITVSWFMLSVSS